MKGPTGSGINDVAADTQYKRGDREFNPPIEMMINDFDDERTIEEEEALERTEDPQEELSNLQRESDMPLEELLAMYNYGDSRVENNVVNNSEVSEHENTNLQETENGMEVVNEVSNQNDDDSGEETEPRSQLHELYMSYSDDDDTASRNDDHYSDWEIQVDDSQKRNEMMVGIHFQAYVPENLSKYDDALPYENEDKLLWNPNVISENDVEDYLVKAQAVLSNNPEEIDNASKRKHIRDDEQALYLLLQCGYNLEEALRRRKMNALSTADTMALWSDEECSNFEAGLRSYGKDFRLIQSDKVRTRSVAELIQFYYLWKKSERYDMFAYKKMVEKKSSVTIPGILDSMDKHVEQFEIGPILRDRHASSNINSLIYADPKRQRIQDSGSENIAVASTSKTSLELSEEGERGSSEENKNISLTLATTSPTPAAISPTHLSTSPTLATTSPTPDAISPTHLTTSPTLATASPTPAAISPTHLTTLPTSTNVEMAFSSSTLPVPSAVSSKVNESTSHAQPVVQ